MRRFDCFFFKTPVKVPVYKMGQMFLYDWLAGHNNVEDFQHFNFDDIDSAFDKVHQVKFHETVFFGTTETICDAADIESPQWLGDDAYASRTHDRWCDLEDLQNG